MVAAVEPQWIEAAGEHLIKRSYSEPHWVEERGFVAAFESTSLYGLTLSSRRRVNYGSVAPREAQRDLRARGARRRAHAAARADSSNTTARCDSEVEAAGGEGAPPRRARRRAGDDATSICSACREHVHSIAALEKWLRGAASGRQQLQMTRRDLMRRDVPEVTRARAIRTRCDSPATSCRWSIASSRQRARRHHGDVPLPLLATADAGDFAAPIPGWRVEKITELLRSAAEAGAQGVRSGARACRARSGGDRRRSQGLQRSARRRGSRASSGTPLTAEELAALPVPDSSALQHPRRRLNGAVLAEGRDLLALKRSIRRVESERSGAPAATRCIDAGISARCRRSRSCSDAACASPSIRRCAITATASS